jgi:hypothetical protein
MPRRAEPVASRERRPFATDEAAAPAPDFVLERLALTASGGRLFTRIWPPVWGQRDGGGEPARAGSRFRALGASGDVLEFRRE